jgi:FkbM family methyltransferase
MVFKFANRAVRMLGRIPFGKSLIGLQELQHDADRLRSDNDALRAQLSNVAIELKDSRSDNEALRAQLSNVAIELKDSRSDNEALRAQLSNFELELKEAQPDNEALRAQLSNVGLELKEARNRLDALTERAKRRESAIATCYRDRRSLILLPRLLDLLSSGERFLIIDAGAREVDRDPRWRPFPSDRLRFIGFEPDEAEAQRLNSTSGPDGLEWQFIPAGLWSSSGRIQFEHNKASGGSSFLTQNRALTDRWKFENLTETTLARDIFFPTMYKEIPVVSLAEWAKDAKINSVDFLKLNVQGSELEILQGAGDLLDSVLGLLVEVAFVESYKNRPMFSDIYRFLADRRFTFFDLLAHHYVGRSAAPVAAQHLVVAEPKLGQLVSQWGQLIEGHALFLRDPLRDQSLQRLDVSRIIKLAALAEAFGQVEYAFELLNWLTDRSDVVDTPLAPKLRDLVAAGTRDYEGLLYNAPSSL